MIYRSVSSVLIDTLSITSTCWSILYIKSYTFAQEWKLYVPGMTFFIAFGDSMPACFDTIGKGMDTVPTRFDALQFKISEYSHAENQRFFYRSENR